MASYQNAEHNTNRKPTPTMKVPDDLDDGKTPRASAKVTTNPPKQSQLIQDKRANIPKPLQTNTFGNLQGARATSKVSENNKLPKMRSDVTSRRFLHSLI